MMDWISVEKRMPETSFSELLLWNGRYTRIGLCLGDAKCKMAPRFYDKFENKVNGITHWMPLPEPPKQHRSNT